MTEHDRKIFEEWQASCEGVTERRLRDCLNCIDDLRSLSHRREGAHILRASHKEIINAMRSLYDLYDDLNAPVVHIGELRELRNASNR